MQNIKIIVFDFDETLYSHPKALDFYIKFIKDAIINLSNNSTEEAMDIIRRYGFDQRGEKRVSFGKVCEEFGIKKEAWEAYKTTHFFEVDYATADTVDNELLRALAQKYSLFLLSNELIEHLEYKAKKLNIDLSVFEKILAPSKQKNSLSIIKKEEYKKIIHEYDISPSEILAIGDRYQVDIAPLVELGGQGIQISNTTELTNLINTKLL